jgi:hypothetical protein
MNATPIQPDSNEREDLARLLPELVERDLPSDRHQQLQELVMSQIHQDLQSAAQVSRRSPKRRLVFLTSALTASAAAAAVVAVVGIGASGSPKGDAVTPASTSVSGQQILLAAAITAAHAPAGSGTYWYVKTASTSGKNGDQSQWESWTERGGRTWVRGEKTNGKLLEITQTIPFRLGGPDVSFKQLQGLPTSPDALKAWISDSVKNSDVRTSAGKLNASMQEQAVFEGLISLVSQLPAPPKVRAAAFQAIASYPNVKSLGAVEGGQGLLISFGQGTPARLVVDPATSQIRETNFFITADGARESIAGGGSFTIVAEWTSQLPK